ncbi:hypothetical protein MN0502_29030 [Arthrobacter sp. MN05-02]|nr:hypothetical protein MN0502_29030 [Arthrobacter sp. MN05-02]
MVEDDGATGEDQGGVGKGPRRRSGPAARLPLQLVAQIAQPTQPELAPEALRGTHGAATPGVVEPPEEGLADARGDRTRRDLGDAGAVQGLLPEDAAGIREDAEPVAPVPVGRSRGVGAVEPHRGGGGPVQRGEQSCRVRRRIDALAVQRQPAPPGTLRGQQDGAGGQPGEGEAHGLR